MEMLMTEELKMILPLVWKYKARILRDAEPASFQELAETLRKWEEESK